MKRAHQGLGDSHNFGRRVTLRDGRVHKPRALLWEWLVLARESPLRRALRGIAERSGIGREAFEFLPELEFTPSPAAHGAVPQEGGEVERITLDALPLLSGDDVTALARIVGRSIALFAWLGVADLHWENLVLGLDARGRVVFGPLDVEMILADLSSPTETKLIPDADPEYADLCRHAAGARRALPYLGKPVAAATLVVMASAYLSTLALLDRSASTIAGVIADVAHLRETPIRVCLRSTGDYVHARAGALWPPLLDAEIQQLDRGDVPYFFRLYGRRGIHYFGDAALKRVETLPLDGDVPQLDPMLSLSRGLRAPSRARLREEGLFTLLGAFDHPALAGAHTSDGLTVRFGARRLVVTVPDGEELESRRDLRAFVGSVYLPCRCGEVESVFVPSVTACDAALDARGGLI